ncbi:LacI family DNA-binding transcriptional regulator [uncultured Cohaesibacter sp.]|uniref:LacI family DNA-binding transcriptional regulator n=1 Tax=uncultured Cohaesibacter sp. TaxID=1002546 RepID=UPI00292D5A13|nr:LacI family DNA-binding transcriptional regulator [uncultured Cohaesibacter sp.]
MATIKDIAKRVGVSPTTVSRVLNYDASLSVSETKRRQIIETAQELNYAPPRMRGKRHQAPEVAPVSITLMHALDPAEELADPYFITIRHSIEKRLSEAGMKIDTHLSAIREMPEDLLQTTGAVIIVGPHGRKIIDALVAAGLPFVCVDFPSDRPDVDCVYPDLERATLDLLDAIWAKGFRKFGFIGALSGEENPRRPYPDLRNRSFMQWFSQRDLDAPANVRFERLTPISGFELTRQLLEADSPPEVIIAANDTMAIGAIQAASSLDLKVPDDIRIVGFNDIPAASLIEPSLTTVAIPAEEIGKTGVELLLERLNGRSFSKKVVLGTHLCWRESC